MHRDFLYLLGWPYYFLFARGCASLPVRLAHGAVRSWARAGINPFDRAYRAAVRRNLRQVFGAGLSLREREAFIERHCGMMAVEHLDTFLYRRLRPRARQPYLTIHGLEHLDAALARGKGVIFLTGHFGRFDLLAATLGKLGYHLSMLTQDLSVDTTHLHPAIVHYCRYKSARLLDHMGGEQIQVGAYLRPVYRSLARNDAVIIVLDAQLGPLGRRRAAKFLGGSMLLQTSFARVASLRGAAIVPFFVYLEGLYHKVGVIEPPLIPSQRPGDPQEIEWLFQGSVDVFERYVKRFPEQYWCWSYLDSFWSPAPPSGVPQAGA
ncbi:MAG: lysophospholipid acyltransferase family protein [Candidatus Tectomicrobia bacterium]|nr:lysophospholipid acyltransferase family protein [Candidatus Tectomicrobia bacterium]